tara:strand:+ start:8988 stop:9356 length:369 start_codon:yes stop_codon:yes gene_type:complete
MKSQENLFGAYAVLAGVVLALTLGFFQASFIQARQEWLYALLAIIGIVVGFASVGNDSKDATTFLLASISLVIVSSMGQDNLVLVGEFGVKIVVILNALLTMFIPATIVVALKTVFSVARVS